MKIVKPVALLAFFALMIFVLIKNYEDPALEISDIESKETNKLFMWKVQGKHKNTLYLLGSIHAGKHSMYPLDKNIEKAYQASDTLVFEIHPDEMEASNVMKQLPKFLSQINKVMYVTGNVENDLTPEYIKKLKRSLPRTLSYDQAKKFKPNLLSALVLARQIEDSPYDVELGIDKHFMNKGKLDKKNILALETMKSQLDAFSAGSMEEQKQTLTQMLDDMTQFEAIMNTTVKILEKGDHKALYKLHISDVIKKSPIHKEQNQRINTERNKKMLEKIESYLNSPNNFMVIVGAIHLCGEEGLVSLLGSKGYTVTQQDKFKKEKVTQP